MIVVARCFKARLATVLLLLNPALAPVVALAEQAIPATSPVVEVEPTDTSPSDAPGANALGEMQTRAPDALAATMLQEDAYIMGPGDAINLEFLDESEPSRTLKIWMDGTASLPLLGNVRLQGLTLSQASRWLEKLYEEKILRPELILSLEQPRPLRVSALGEVLRPGLYRLDFDDNESATEGLGGGGAMPTLVDLIQKAGGTNLEADLRNVEVQRRVPGVEGRYKRARFNLWALVRDGDQSQNPVLFDGDTVRLPRAERLPASQDVELAATTLSPVSIQVIMNGEVKGGGTISVPANTPLMQAILRAGGTVEWRANNRDIQLIRMNRNGTVSKKRYRYDPSLDASNLNNPPLKEGDVVVVEKNLLASTTDALGGIAEPITGLVNIWALFKLIQDD